MAGIHYLTGLIVGAGPGISASVARGLAAAGLKVGLAARNIDKLAPLAQEIGAERFAIDATDPTAVTHVFDEADARLGVPDVVMYNASAHPHGPITELDPEDVRKAVEILAFGGFLVVQQEARRMIPHGKGAILLRVRVPASRVIRTPLRSPWASSRCAASLKARRASWGRREFTSHTL
jgi:NAD(P)-dependent dehydrogenase (short-subunit alcohol dehydrogenase family)